MGMSTYDLEIRSQTCFMVLTVSVVLLYEYKIISTREVN